MKSLCAGNSSKYGLSALPIVDAVINGRKVRALIDTGCSRSILASWLCKSSGGSSCSIISVDGSEVSCIGEASVSVVAMGRSVDVSCLIARKLFSGVGSVLGMDFILAVGGVQVSNEGVSLTKTHIGRTPKSLPGGSDVAAVSQLSEVITVEDSDFVATFDEGKWTVKWKWKNDIPPKLRNGIDCYKSTKQPEICKRFEEEVEGWIAKGWLQPCSEARTQGIIPLMAVVQENKDKVRPVMDFRELNMFVESHPGIDASVCDETMREWRRLPEPLRLVDLKSAYLQIHIDHSLWSYQRVVFKGQMYNLTRLGFGLNSAPKIMSKILGEVLSRDKLVSRGTSSYIDDIIVNENIVSVEKVVDHLKRFGLETKPPEDLEGGRVLGLSLYREKEGSPLKFKRGNSIPETVEATLTRRELFSICGKLVGHYPVCGWLRVACSYVKRECEGERWDDEVGEKAVLIIQEILGKIKVCDPVNGSWSVPDVKSGTLWCDASSLALGAVFELGGVVVEDGAWLRKQSDVSHINVAELEAVLKGFNLALKWNVDTVLVKTDSATVCSWLRSVLTGEFRVKVSGMSEMLVKRRLSVLHELIKEYGLVVEVELVQSSRNKADVMTRVDKKWMRRSEFVNVCVGSMDDLMKLHEQHHFGVDRSLYLARMVDPTVKREDVEACVKSCMHCRSIDPAPVKHSPGLLSCEDNWSRLAMDVTHHGSEHYLTLIDCGPSRFTIWRLIRSENSQDVCRNVEEIFRERGPPREILMDNSAAFRSHQLAELCERWGVRRHYRAAYKPSGNGIVERIHRTIKSLAARGRCSPLQTVFWYNLSAKHRDDVDSAPCTVLHKYSWRYPLIDESSECEVIDVGIKVGEKVLVKPPQARCTSRWSVGDVTKVNSANNVEVNGIPRHILDIRKLFDDDDEGCGDGANTAHVEEESLLIISDDEIPDDSNGVDAADKEVRRSSARQRRPPVWMKDYVG